MALLPSASCSSSSKGGKYDVFLSFRGEDTRKRFTDHLYTALKQKCISTFKDDEKLKQGTLIAPELLKAIKESKFAVIILSKDYASSKWCLIELTKIVECMEKTGLVVLPVFHYVDPSDVRNHKGIFAEAFDRHEESFKDMGNVETWKAALTKVANLSGWDLKDKYESKVIQEIIGRICTELYNKFSSVCEDLVGMDSCVEEMLDSYFGEGLGDVRFVGICGMGGMGKTTLAQEICKRISGHGILWMHDLLQDMGQEIVRRESPREPGGRSRLWIYKDVIRVLKNNIGTEAVEGIMLKVPIQKMEHLHAEAFSKMKNLRFLKIGDEKFPQDLINGTMQLPKSLNYLSDELRVIEWHRYPFKSMPTSFQPNKLVELKMCRCRIKHLWKGIMNLNELRLIDLSDSQNLIEMPDLSGASKLKQLILRRCIRLSKIHASLGNLKRLIRLDLSGCKNLSSLPNVCCYLMSLKILTVSGCSKINELPENLGNIKGLEELDVSETAITELPSSFVLLKNLKVLSLDRCEGLSSISSNKLISFPLMPKRRVDPTGMLGRSLSNLWSLTTLNLSYCNLHAIPDSLGCLSSLRYLDLKGNNFVCLPQSLTQLSNMWDLSLCGCKHLRSLPELPSNIWHINANGCSSLETFPIRPEDGSYPHLFLLGCDKLINNEDYDDMLLTKLRHHITKGDPNYSITIPGREIPKWFRHQSVGTSMNLQVPSDKLKGIVVGAVFVLRHHHPLPQLHSDDESFGEYIFTHRLSWYLKANGYQSRRILNGISFSEQYGKIESYYLYLNYHCYRSCNLKLKENWIQDANGFVQIEVGFETYGPGLEVTKWGTHLILEQDIEDLNQTMRRCSSSSSCSTTPYEDDLEDSAKDAKTK